MSDNNPDEIAPEQVSSFIDKVLKTKDPATVGLRKIIRRKAEEDNGFYVHKPELVEFEFNGKTQKGFGEDEQRILELEKTVADLKIELKKNLNQAQKAVQAAFSKGKASGLTEGLEKGKTETTEIYERKIDEIQLRVGNILKTFEEEKRNLIKNSEHILLQLSTEVAKKIIASELTTNTDIVLSVLKKALNSIAEKNNVIIRVSSGDLETVSERKSFWSPVSDNLKNITIEQDSRLSSGDCIIESDSGITDARLSVQCDELLELIQKTWENNYASQSSSTASEKSDS